MRYARPRGLRPNQNGEPAEPHSWKPGRRRMRPNQASDDVFIYQAALWCYDDGAAIRAELTQAGKAPRDPDDERSYDSDDFPKGPFSDGGGEADGPQHCDAGESCINAITLPSGHKIGAWLENPLTEDGVAYVCEAVKEGGEVAELWAQWYSDDLSYVGCEVGEREDDDEDEQEENPRRRRSGRASMRRNAEEIPIANPGEVDFFEDNKFVREGPLWRFAFGAYGTTHVYVWADGVESAFEEAVEWLDDNAPGHLIELTPEDYKRAAEDEGLTWKETWPDWDDPKWEQVAQAAEADLTQIGHTTLKHGSFVASYEWTVDEVPRGSAEWTEVVERSRAEAGE